MQIYAICMLHPNLVLCDKDFEMKNKLLSPNMELLSCLKKPICTCGNMFIIISLQCKKVE